MHIKCIHELCIIILIFQSYLHHIRVISWFYNDFGNISQFFYVFELTLHWQKTLFSIFWCFRDPNDVKLTWKFMRIIFWKEESVGAKEVKKWRPEGRKRVARAARFLGHVGPLIWALVAPLPSIFLPKVSSWPETTIKIVSRRLSEGGRQKHRNTETEIWSYRLEGKNSGGALPADRKSVV